MPPCQPQENIITERYAEHRWIVEVQDLSWILHKIWIILVPSLWPGNWKPLRRRSVHLVCYQLSSWNISEIFNLTLEFAIQVDFISLNSLGMAGWGCGEKGPATFLFTSILPAHFTELHTVRSGFFCIMWLSLKEGPLNNEWLHAIGNYPEPCDIFHLTFKWEIEVQWPLFRVAFVKNKSAHEIPIFNLHQSAHPNSARLKVKSLPSASDLNDNIFLLIILSYISFLQVSQNMHLLAKKIF